MRAERVGIDSFQFSRHLFGLIKAAESDDTLVVQQVVQMLSQMGTKKSYPILRRLSRQKDEEISSAAKNALTTIIYREKTKKAG